MRDQTLSEPQSGAQKARRGAAGGAAYQVAPSAWDRLGSGLREERESGWGPSNAVCNQALTYTNQTFITLEGSGLVSFSENIPDHWSKE